MKKSLLQKNCKNVQELSDELTDARLVGKEATVAEKKQFIATFGCAQVNAQRFHRVYAENEKEARAYMFERFGDQWANLYNSEKEAGVHEWRLKELK